MRKLISRTLKGASKRVKYQEIMWKLLRNI